MEAFGYAGKILSVDLSTGKSSVLPTAEYADRFIGGRGIGAKIYWDQVSPDTKAFDPENRLIFTTGPAAGFTRLAGSRWQVCGKSPSSDPEFFSYANLGGSWGSRLKFAGYDGLVITGKASNPVYLFIDNDHVRIEDAVSFWGLSAAETVSGLKTKLGSNVRVITMGPAGENLVSFATLFADNDTTGSGGLGSVMGSKNLKAVCVQGDRKPVAAHPQALGALADRLLKLRKKTWSVYPSPAPGRTRRQPCYGCIDGCLREYYRMEDGTKVKFFCQAGNLYFRPAMKYYKGWNEAIVNATRLCNEYGLDTVVLEPMMAWLVNCYRKGILGEEETGLPLEKFGSNEFIETLVRKISLREDFGDVLAMGTLKAAASVGKGAGELIGDSISTRASEMSDYDPRLYITTALFYAVEPRRPIQHLHELSFTNLQWMEWLKKGPNGFFSTKDYMAVAEKFWGGRIAVDYSTIEGKALAAKKIQDRQYVKESLILCDFLWPIIWVRDSDNHVGDPSLESQVFSAITGKETDEKGLYEIGERIFNLQRAILLREGWGGRNGDKLADYMHELPLEKVLLNRDCLMLGTDGTTISRKGKVLERNDFEKMKDEYYLLRGWNVESGYPEPAKLEKLGLGDVAECLQEKGF